MGALQHIDRDKKQVYNGLEVSLGIAPILATLSNLSKLRSCPAWNLYLINVETIIRDRKDDQSTIAQRAKATLQDCTVLAQYIAAYSRVALNNNHKVQPVLCFYLPHYEKIPKPYLKEKLPKGTEERWKVRDEVLKLLKSQSYQTQYEDVQVMYLEVGATGRWPHKDLLDDLNKQLIYGKDKFDSIKYRKVLMVSHVPLDFHLYKVFQEFTVLESYTGNLKQFKQFGKKVFSDESMPFNKYTHLLLGDKWYLSTLVNNATKKQLKERAASSRWTLIPEADVLDTLLKMHPVTDSLYLKPEI